MLAFLMIKVLKDNDQIFREFEPNTKFILIEHQIYHQEIFIKTVIGFPTIETSDGRVNYVKEGLHNK